jgi:1-acyl-sn-glycerol-3-phosphate acyltransferase
MAVLWSWIYVIPLIILSTAFFGIGSFVISLFDRTPPRQLRVARMWARSLLRIVGVKVTVEGLDRIQPGGNYVFVSNHVSYMDIPVVLGTVPEDFLFLAKAELFKIPFLGTHLKTAGHVLVPREDPRSAIKTLQHTAALLHDGRSTLVFPEGGRTATGELQEFKDGAAFLAIRAQIPVVPLAMLGMRSILRMHTLTFHRGPVTLRIGEPITTAGMTTHQRAELTATVRQKIVEMLGEATGRTTG